MYSDADLVKRILMSKDENAFSQLMLQHERMVRNLLTRYCRRDNHSVDDLIQETFLRAYLSLEKFRGESKFTTWLYRIATNVVADRYRRKKIHYCAIESVSEIPDVTAELHHSDMCRDVAKAMSNISEAQKIAVRLCLQEGYSHADAARAMKIPLGTVKSHVARGKLHLKKFLVQWSPAVLDQ